MNRELNTQQVNDLTNDVDTLGFILDGNNITYLRLRPCHQLFKIRAKNPGLASTSSAGRGSLSLVS